MVSKIIIAFCFVAVVAAIPAQPGWGAGGGAGVFLPPWISSAPWFPQWTPCTTVGSSCSDCSTKIVCTKIGGLQRACSDPTKPYCNLGECSATPSEECSAPVVPENAA
ncbi:peritrophin type-A domain protein 2 [Danaus plexippus plexippus]|uniref:Peritrophin type-A domain protein 2 n=1 Tax=Danaus plexippus plexippus TaxID=278856 RepID=A0A212EQZ7_DANPL|nr:peritrophin type-A domain protein 2 [Danaus plexippus plexippus]